MSALSDKARLAALAIAAAVAVAVPLSQRHEGYRGAAYLDPVGVLTQCYGETRDVDPARIYSRGECAAKLRARMARDYAPPLLACMPGLANSGRTNQFAALLDASYNTGPAPVCRRFAPLVNAGRLAEACARLPGWYTTARDRRTGVRREFPGLVRRRIDERDLCLKGLNR